ncbi:MAG: extracellular solute-binding protein [Alphaproteobacteria bacterium]|nr:extracellular solute-binding protein [Alphaproteobacteria bacterium]
MEIKGSTETKRSVMMVIVTFIISFYTSGVRAEEKIWRHGVSLIGELKYHPDFKHFDYVNPEAPKGGQLRLATTGTFNTLNPAIPKGILPPGLYRIYDSLTTTGHDETSSEYGLLAEAISYPDDLSSVTYRLRANAKWHDGKPITVEDVIFSFQTFKKMHPVRSSYYRDVLKVEKTGPRDVTFTLKQKGNRKLPLILGKLLILPQHWWKGKNPSGKLRNIALTTTEPTLGSGPYRIKEVVSGQHIVYERVKDYWGKKLPSNRGMYNFEKIRYDVYQDSHIAFEAFKADRFDWHIENYAKRWATAYNFPALKKGLVKIQEFSQSRYHIMQAYIFNLRREKFKDPRVRRAFNYAFNFEAINTSLFHNQYQRINSYFGNSELASSGLPQTAELKILKSIRSRIPVQIFTTPYTNPKGGKSLIMRKNLRKASQLLQEAGWEIRAGKRVNAKTGEIMSVEFLYAAQEFERIILSYKPWLTRLGIQIKPKRVSSSEYVTLLRNFDFDIITNGWYQSLSPGSELREVFGSKAADTPGSSNFAGIKDPAIDELIEKIVFADNRETITAAAKALDLVLLWNHYTIPQYSQKNTRTARWDRFSYPEKLPPYSFGFPEIWWWNPDKAAYIKAQK